MMELSIMNVRVLTLPIQAMSGVLLKLRQSIITQSLMADGVIVRRAALVQVSLMVYILYIRHSEHIVAISINEFFIYFSCLMI